MGEGACRLAVDIGGTFTDVVLWSAEGQTIAKVLTTAQAPEQGVLTAVDQVLNKTGRLLSDVSLMIHGTTLATNALIERKGAITAFLTSDDDFERLVADIHANLDRAVDDLMSVAPDHIIVGVSAESFWDGADGAEVIRNRLAEKTGVSITLGSDAARVALEAVAAQRIGVLTPYWPVADERVRQYFNQCGFTAVRVTGLKATSPLNIAEQSRDTLRHAILDLDGDDIDTIVQVGTNLALAALVDEFEQELGKPVIAINVALYWHALRHNGINEPIPGFGRLLKNL